MQHESHSWSLILAIATVLLAFPLSLAANLATPIIKTWWARRSVASLRDEINYLQTKLAKLEGSHTELSKKDDLILMGVARCLEAGTIAVGMLGIILVVMSGSPMMIVRKQDNRFLIFFAIAAMLLAGAALGVVSVKINNFRQDNSSDYLRKMRVAVEEMKEDLVRRTNP